MDPCVYRRYEPDPQRMVEALVLILGRATQGGTDGPSRPQHEAEGGSVNERRCHGAIIEEYHNDNRIRSVQSSVLAGLRYQLAFACYRVCQNDMSTMLGDAA
jgi:hypothetical protein